MTLVLLLCKMTCNWFVLFLLHHADSLPFFGQRHISIMAYEDCPTLPLTAVIRHNLTISATGRGGTIVNGYLNVTEDVVLDSGEKNLSGDWDMIRHTKRKKKVHMKVVVDLYSCGEQSTLHTENCEFMLKTSQSNPCILHEDKTQFWSSFIASIKPSISCVGNTLLKNIYKVTNGTYQVTSKTKIYLPDNHWTLKMQYLNDKKEVIECVLQQIDVYTSRS